MTKASQPRAERDLHVREDSGRAHVEVEGLTVVYRMGAREVTALQDFALEVPKGQFLCVRGRSGSGKSTLLHALAGLRRPSRGTVRVGSIDITKLRPNETSLYLRRHCGMIFQFFNLLPMLTVAENVAFALRLDGMDSGTIRKRVDELLNDLEMGERRDHYPDQLSGGEMQRVAIARALAIEPEIILADEPTGNLDTASGIQVWALLGDVVRKKQVTTIMVTHDPDATAYADRVVVLEDGHIMQDTGVLPSVYRESR